jgi:hypothetical protein
LTWLMSPLALSRNRGDVADAGPESRRPSHMNSRRAVVEGRTQSFGLGQVTRPSGAVRMRISVRDPQQLAEIEWFTVETAVGLRGD